MALRARKVSGAFEKRAPGQGHCAFLHPDVEMGTSEFNVTMVTLGWISTSSRGVFTLLAT